MSAYIINLRLVLLQYRPIAKKIQYNGENTCKNLQKTTVVGKTGHKTQAMQRPH